MLLFTDTRANHTNQLLTETDSQQSNLFKRRSIATMKICGLRILCSFYICVLVRGKHFGKPSNPLVGITSHLLIQSGGAQITTTERINTFKPRYAPEDRRERSTVFLSESETIGEDIRCTKQSSDIRKNHNECAELESDILNDNFQFEASYKMSEIATTCNAPSKKSASLVSRIISTYTRFLANHALVTKSVTAGLISGLADICAQCFEQRVDGASILKMILSLDRRRLFGMVFESVFLSGPLMHYAYDFMEDLVPVHDSKDDESTTECHEQGGNSTVSSLQRWLAATFHVILDIIVLGPVFVLSLMVTTSVIEGKVGSLKTELMTQFGPALWASTLASIGFIPTQLLAFRFLPVQFRLLFVNLQDIVWDAIVSFMVHKAR